MSRSNHGDAVGTLEGIAASVLRDVREVTLAIGDRRIQVRELSGSETHSSVFRYELAFPLPLPLPRRAELLGKQADLVLRDWLNQTRTIRGVISSVDCRVFDPENGFVRLTLRSPLHLLTLGRTSRAFLEQTAIEACITVIASHGLTVTSRLIHDYPKVPYRTQRDESDWDFVQRTLAAEGVAMFVDHGTHAIVLLDDAASGEADLSLAVTTESDMQNPREVIVELGAEGLATSTAYATRTAAHENPSLKLESKSGDGPYEVYAPFVRGAPDPAAVARRAALELDRTTGTRGMVAGKATSLRLYPGERLEIGGDTTLGGTYVITEVAVGLGDDDKTFSTRFRAVSQGTAIRPEREAVKVGAHVGLELGVVVAAEGDEVYPDSQGRVRVQMLWDREGTRDATSGTWTRVTQRGAPGSMMFPRTGWTMAIMGEEGSSDLPMTLGRIFDGEHPPSYALPDNMTRVVYRTLTTPGGGSANEIHFEDKKGAENMFWHASRDLHLITKNDLYEQVRRDAKHEIGQHQSFRIGDDSAELVGRDRTTTIGTDRTIETGASRAAASGVEVRTIGGSRTLKVGGSHGETSKDRKLKVGAAQINISLGEITQRSKLGATTVGGLELGVSGESSTHANGAVAIETTGAVRLQFADRNGVLGVAKDMKDTVLGAMSLDAGKDIILDTETDAKFDILGALTGAADDITFEAAESIVFRCGKSVVRLEPKEIHLGATVIALDGATLEFLTTMVEHNG